MSDSTPPPQSSRMRHLQETLAAGQAGDTTSGDEGTSARLSRTFGRYQIERVLGEGAMGSVYLAHDSQLDRKVALKVPKFDLTTDSEFIERFYREARAAATLSHPNICPVFDVGQIDGQHYITMAYVQGHPLSDYVNSQKPPSSRTVAIVVRKIALALHEAHALGVVHRDLKPANIMIDQRNEPIVMDFGLARQLDQNQDVRLTREGTIMGSPAYMAPEQLDGNVDRIGPASDVYSLGVMLYELLTGELPYRGSGSVMSIIAEILSKPPPNPQESRSDLGDELTMICGKSMAKNLEDRYGAMEEVAQALAAFLKVTADSSAAKQTVSDPPSDTGLIRLDEQVQLVRSLCKDAEFGAAVTMLEKIANVNDPKAEKFSQWAGQQLPRIRAASEKQKSLFDLEADPFQPPGGSLQPATEEILAPGKLLAANARADAGGILPRWLWPIISVPVALIVLLVLAVVLARWFDGTSPDASPEIGHLTAEPSGGHQVPGATAPPTAVGGVVTDRQHKTGPPEKPLRVPSTTRPTAPVKRNQFRQPTFLFQSKSVDELFGKLDRNRNEVLEESEIPRRDVHRFMIADANADKMVTKDELEQLLNSFRVERENGRSIPRRPGTANPFVAGRIMQHDTNRDGVISRGELPLQLRPFVDEGDANADGVLDRFEVKQLSGWLGRPPQPEGVRSRVRRPDGTIDPEHRRPQ